MRSAAVLLALLPSVALAQGIAKKLPADPNSLEFVYDPDKTYPLTMQYSMQCVVQISPNEQMLQTVLNPGAPVETLDLKKAQSDEPLINSVPLVGAVPGGPTSVTIISKDMTGRQRTYPLLINVVKPPGDGKIADGVCLKVKFTYSAALEAPSAPGAASTKPSWKEQQAKKQADIAKARLNADPFYGPQNDNYWVSGHDPDIAPRYAPHDNGTVTLFDFPGPAPAIMLVESRGEPNVCKGQKPTSEELHAPEQTLNQERYLDKVLVRATGWHFRLRVNSTAPDPTPGKTMDIWNCGYRFVPDTGTGTGSDDVVRQVITQR